MLSSHAPSRCGDVDILWCVHWVQSVSPCRCNQPAAISGSVRTNRACEFGCKPSVGWHRVHVQLHSWQSTVQRAA
jgi:hypothetical protein